MSTKQKEKLIVNANEIKDIRIQEMVVPVGFFNFNSFPQTIVEIDIILNTINIPEYKKNRNHFVNVIFKNSKNSNLIKEISEDLDKYDLFIQSINTSFGITKKAETIIRLRNSHLNIYDLQVAEIEKERRERESIDYSEEIDEYDEYEYYEPYQR